jgi:hypothetical protein
MPKVKEWLIREVQILKTGANNHDTDQLILMYRGAARDGTPAAFQHFEQALEDHLVKLRRERALYSHARMRA